MTQGTANCDTETMLRRVAEHAGGRPIVVKADPVSNTEADRAAIAKLVAQGIDLIPTDAENHDILPRCAVTVSFNAAAALEGFLHRKPAVLFGQADFHHICETVQETANFGQALTSAVQSAHDYPRFLYWYFQTFCLSVDAPDLEPQILDTFAFQGFPAARLGLRSLPLGFFQPTDSKVAAAHQLQTYFDARPDVQSASDFTPLKVRSTSWVFRAKIDGQDTVVKRYFGGDLGQKIKDLKGELRTLETHFGASDCQANQFRMAWTHDGIVILSYAPGTRLDKAIAALHGPARAALMTHAGRWLASYTSLRHRDTNFGPFFWVKRLQRMDKTQVATKADRDLLARLLDNMRAQARILRGCAVRQAASHGDFAGINAHFDGTTIYGVDIQGECWTAIAREVARFLVWQQIHDPARQAETRFGINATDMDAFLNGDPLDALEHTTTLPFFIAEQLYARFVEDYAQPDVRRTTRKVLEAYLDQPL